MKLDKKYYYILLAFVCCNLFSVNAHAQNKAHISGVLLDSSNKPYVGVNISLEKGKGKTRTLADGSYTLEVPSGKDLTVEFSFSQVKKHFPIKALAPDENYTFSPKLDFEYETAEAKVVAKRDNKPMMRVIHPKDFEAQPNTAGGIEGVIKMIGLGVSSNNELSSQYNVRGGNYDENLVYINGMEIFRPQLARSGQQEGLSVINSDMVDYLSFSSGGFDARYGDKLSSVLDIHYKEPDTFSAKVSASLLGGGVTIEGSSDNHRFRYMFGARYKTNQYLLNSLNVQGNYQPKFTDAQGLLSYDVTDKFNISYFAYYGSNYYLSQPQSQQTSFGTATQSFQLNVDYFGQDILEYTTLMNGLTFKYRLTKHDSIEWVSAGYSNDERELEDVGGDYELGQLDNDPSSNNFGKVKALLGSGEYFTHARDILQYTIINTEIKGGHTNERNLNLQWGLKAQHEDIHDQLNDYSYVDSSGYSVPHNPTIGNHSPDQNLNLSQYIYSRNNQAWNRYSGYVQNTWLLDKASNATLTFGTRANYWDYNKELIISPRFLFFFEPNLKYNKKLMEQNLPDTSLQKMLKTPWRLKAAGGIYDQPPFYREMRDLYGNLNPNIRAQKSAQIVLGSDYSFILWDRPFKFTTEAYYKYLWDVIPYEIDDVQIRYFAVNDAKGFATGLDFQLNGEFVKDNPSWISLSFLKTMEDINNDVYTKVDPNTGEVLTIHPGYIPRPTDQLVRFSLFFQDYLPGRPKYRVHLNFVYATGLPFGPPDYNRYKDTLRYPSYYRTDIGFSRLIYNRSSMGAKGGMLKYVKNIWASLEVFNLFNINNTISYTWVKDVAGNSWGIPNYLTSRRLNLNIQVKF